MGRDLNFLKNIHLKNNIIFAKPKKVLQDNGLLCSSMVGANAIFVAEYGTFKGFKSIGVVRSIQKQGKKNPLRMMKPWKST